MALALARPKPEIKTLRLAHPVVRTSSTLEVGAVGALLLSAVGLWLFVIPLELLAFVA